MLASKAYYYYYDQWIITKFEIIMFVNLASRQICLSLLPKLIYLHIFLKHKTLSCMANLVKKLSYYNDHHSQ